MKINWNEKYNTISVYSFLVISSLILFSLGLFKMEIITTKLGGMLSLFEPFIIGFSIAYLCNFILEYYEDKVFKLKPFNGVKRKRGLGLLFTYLTVFVMLGLFISFVLPQLIDSILGLVNDIPGYVKNLNSMSANLISKLDVKAEYYDTLVSGYNSFIDYVIKTATGLIPVLAGAVSKVIGSVWNIVLGLIISIYLLIEKEKFIAISKKMVYAFASEKRAARVLELTHRSNDTFGRFLVGKIIDSAIIGVLTFIVLTIFNVPYTLLVATIVGITNIVPFFGPFIGAVPSFIIILFVSPEKAITFVFIILVIQQLDGNFIGPKILGDSIGISAFWIIFSILIAGELFGFVGMVLGVPMFAVIYSIIKENVENRLRKKGMATETGAYNK